MSSLNFERPRNLLIYTQVDHIRYDQGDGWSKASIIIAVSIDGERKKKKLGGGGMRKKEKHDFFSFCFM